MNIRNYIVVFIGIVSLACCDSSLVYTDISRISGNAWSKDDVKKFTFYPSDSINGHNIFLFIRNDDDYSYSNLFLITSISDPIGDVVIDTLEYEMAEPDGKFLGKGIFLKDNKLWYKEDIKFIISENPYEIKVSHAMRKNGAKSGVDMLKGITDVGVIIEKSNHP